MIVKMLTCECGPNGNFGIGDHRTVTDDVGQMLIVTGHAEFVRRTPVEKAVVEPEVTAAAPVEVAVPPAPEAHGKRRK